MDDQQPYRVYCYTDEDGRIVGEVPELPDCMSQGRTLEILDNIRDAIASCVAVRRKLGMTERVPFQDVTVTAAA